MPRLKQPKTLSNLAIDSLVETAVHCCDELSISGDETQLCNSIAELKKYLLVHLPGVLFAEFCRRFVERFFSIAKEPDWWLRNRPDNHNRAALEMILDLDIVGITCESSVLRYMKPRQEHRLRGLKTLDVSRLHSWEIASIKFSNYQLQDLTTLIFPKFCTDRHLQIIGTSCSKLQILKIQESKDVTNKGLCALCPCSELRIINFQNCSVTDYGVNQLLDVHKKLEEFNVSEYQKHPNTGFDVLSRPISLVCQSVQRFSLEADPVTDAHLHSIAALFPNLIYIQFRCEFTGDLCILKGLKHLEEIDFGIDSEGFNIRDIKQLLKSIGNNITRLTLPFEVTVGQDDLDFISTVCGNIERMRFYYRLVIPAGMIRPCSLQLKVKDFECSVYLISHRDSGILELEFCKILRL